jgi:hypothetical protein
MTFFHASMWTSACTTVGHIVRSPLAGHWSKLPFVRPGVMQMLGRRFTMSCMIHKHDTVRPLPNSTYRAQIVRFRIVATEWPVTLVSDT